MSNMDGRSGWSGTVEQCADALSLLLADGKLNYHRAPNDIIDDAFIFEKTTGLKHLFKTVVKGNGKYSQFVKAILKLMSDGRYGRGYILRIYYTRIYVYTGARLSIERYIYIERER